MSRSHVPPLLLAAVLCAACGNTGTNGSTGAAPDPTGSSGTGAGRGGEGSTTAAGAGEGTGGGTAPAAARSRDLGAGATYRDLVASLQAVGADGAGECILAGGRDAAATARVLAPYRPAMELADDAILDLPALVDQTPQLVAAVRTPHGLVQDAEPNVWLATLTPVSGAFSQASPLPILLVGAGSVRFGAVIRHGTVPDRWTTLAGDDLDRFRRQVVPRATALVVVAGPGVPVHRLREVLGWLDGFQGEVALAVATEPGPRPPGGARDAPRDTLANIDRRNPPAGLCPLGISDVPTGMRPTQGMQWTFPARERFQQAAEAACAGALPADSDGGEVAVSMRILRDGSVGEACIMRDPVGDPGLRECLLRAARAMSFGRLPDGDFANLALGATFRPRGVPLTALCDP